MNKTILFFIIFILAGCSPQRRLARLLERYPLPEVHDTVYLPGKTVYKDTTIYRYLPGEIDTVEIQVPVPFAIPDTSVTALTSLATARAYLKHNRLGLSLIQNDSLFKFLLDSAIRENRDTIKIETVKEVPKLVPPNPFWRNGFWVLVGVLIVSLVVFAFFVTRKR
jgi:hypothetical protein